MSEHEPLFVTWEEGDEVGKAAAMAGATAALNKVMPIIRTSGSVTVRDSYSARDYDERRPLEALPVRPRDIIRQCMEAYDEFSIIRNTIELMADFATQGIGLSHPIEGVERFYREWWRRINGPERSERFLNLLYRTGNVIAHRSTGKISVEQATEFKKAVSTKAKTAFTDLPFVKENEIPTGYFFLNPLSIQVVAEETAPFFGSENFVFSLILPDSFLSSIRDDPMVYGLLPQDMQQVVKKNIGWIPLDRKKLILSYYKKDDWAVWAKPLTYSILPELRILRKLRQSDHAALDGVISTIRIWKLGDLDNRIMPTDAAIARLASQLSTNVQGGVMDLVWGPAISLSETSNSSHSFLGSAKYDPTVSSIKDGLGLPTMTAGLTNSFISMKTLTERLQYGRSQLRTFWEPEIRAVQRAMNFSKPAILDYDRMLLTDEAAEKALMIQLLDRDGVSLETLQDLFGLCPEIEQVRIRREHKRRDQGRIPPKASPWHDPQQNFGLLKILTQLGGLAPGEIGVDIKPRPKGQKTPLEQKGEISAAKTPKGGPGGQPQQGRPKNSKDKQKRKKKRVLPRAAAIHWALRAQQELADIVTPAFLQACGKKNLRELTDEESDRFEKFKFAALYQVGLGEKVTEEKVTSLLRNEMPVPAFVSGLLQKTLEEYQDNSGQRPTLEIIRRSQALVVALCKVADVKPATCDTSDGSSPLP